jgi:hypothetical protein
MKQKADSLRKKKKNKVANKPLAKVTKRRKEKTQNNKMGDEKGHITTNQ